MNLTLNPNYRAPLIGILAAALLIGSFLLGTTQSSARAASGTGGGSAGDVLTSASAGGKLTVTGTGTVTGTPNQLVLSMGVQANAPSVASALSQANSAISKVMTSLERNGVTKANIQTSGLSIQPNYRGRGQSPVGYSVSEQLTATLTILIKAGTQIQDAVTAGGNAVTVDGVSLNLTDTGGLLQRARTRAVQDAQAKAAQFARAMHEQLGAVISISDQTTLPTPVYNTPAFASSGAAAPSVPVSAGSQQISVQINVTYSIG
jgi:uncharacterized protein YggE